VREGLHLGVCGARVAGPVGHRQHHQAQQRAPVAPGVQAGVLVLPDQQEPLCARVRGGQCAHGVQREAVATAVDLDAVQHEAWLVGDGGLHHGHAVLGAADDATALCLLPGVPGGYPAHLVQAQLGQRGLGQRHVRVVHGVEGAAEDAHAARGVALRAARRWVHFSQSRGGRKSVYSRASGEPASGCQS